MNGLIRKMKILLSLMLERIQNSKSHVFLGDFYILPISKVSAEYVKTKISDLKDKKFVVLCHAGIRSYNFGQWALENNLVNEIWNLEEGIDGWSQYIDQTIPRY